MPPVYRLRHPWLSKLGDDCFDPAFVAALADGRPEALDALVARPHPDVVTFPLFSQRFCDALRVEAHTFEHWCGHRGVGPTRPNTMNRYGVVLAELRLDGALDALLEDRLLPLTARYFEAHGGANLDHQHSFLVEYALDGDTDLGFHVDDSEVTLNACLGADFEGGEVYFRGVRCAEHRQTPERPEERFDLAHRVGHGALHAGAHRHGVLPLRAGRRTNLIAWFRDSRLRTRRARQAPTCEPWCAEHPRRKAA